MGESATKLCCAAELTLTRSRMMHTAREKGLKHRSLSKSYILFSSSENPVRVIKRWSPEALTTSQLRTNGRASLIFLKLFIRFRFSTNREEEMTLGVLANDASWPDGLCRLIAAIKPWR